MPQPAHWPRVSECLDEALDLDAEQRSAWLAALQRTEPLIADAVAALLTEHAAVQRERFLEIPARWPGAIASLQGRRLGAYTLQALIGQGGMGTVWRALRSDGTYDGAVAIKLLNTALIGAAGVARFQREGSILARLQYPHIAHLLDAGVTEDGQPYLVLELIDGEAIDTYCDRHQLSVEARIRLFLDVLGAVEHAHAHLVVHRDLKPSNVLVMEGGQVKLLDFGIAKLMEAEPGDGSAALTQEGTRALTPQYAAPEQLQGGPISTATDVYALGVMLYRLLSGRHPTGVAGASAAEFIRATLDTEPARLSEPMMTNPGVSEEEGGRIASDRATSRAGLQRQLRGDLDNILARALRKPAAERYASVAALADDLRRHLAHEPVVARPDSLAYRSAKFVRRHRAIVAALAVLVLTVSAGLVGTITQARRAEAQASRAQHERDNALRELANAESSNEFVSNLLGEGFDRPFTTPELLARGEVLVERQFAADPAQRARLEFILAKLYGQAMHAKKAAELMEQARDSARNVADLSLQADIDCQLGGERAIAGGFDAGRAMLDAAVTRLQGASEIDRTVLASCLHVRSQVNKYRGDAKAALADAQAALDTLGNPRPDQRTLAIQIRIALASAEGNLGRSAEAVKGYRTAIAELDAMGRGQAQMVATMYNNLGLLLSRGGQTLSAVEAYEKALEAARGFGGSGPDATLEGNYAKLLIELGRPREAMPLIEHALVVAKARGNKDSTPTLLLQGALAWCATQDLVRCAEMLAAARVALASALPPGHSRFGTLEMTEAQLALARGDLAQARAGLTRAVAIFDAAKDRNRIAIRALTLLARTEQQLGEVDAAQANAAKAVTQAREAMTGFEHSEWLGSALVAQGLVQRSRRDSAAAHDSWRAALVELQASVGATAPATIEAQRLLADS